MTVREYPISDRASWLRQREKYVTASVAGALLGVHPFMSRLELWALKSGLTSENPEETPPMRRGRLLEPVAIELLREERPTWRIEQPGVFLADDEARLGATPDAYAYDPSRPGRGLIQIKTVEQGVFRAKWLNDDGEVEPPLWIAVQSLIEANLAGASWAAVAPMVIGYGLDMRPVEIPAHPGVLARVRYEADAFWDAVDAGEAPPTDHARDGELLSRLYSEDNGREIDLTGDNELPGLLDERAALVGNIGPLTSRVEAIDTEIKSKLGPHERGHLPGWAIRWATEKRRDRYVPPTTLRRLSIKPTR